MLFRLSSSETTFSTAAFVATAALTTAIADGERLVPGTTATGGEDPSGQSNSDGSFLPRKIEAGHGVAKGVHAESESHEEISQSLLLDNKTRSTEKKPPSADSDNTLPNDIDVGVLDVGFVRVAEDDDHPVNPSIEHRNSRTRFLASYDCSLCGDSRPVLLADTDMQVLIGDCESANFIVGGNCPSKVECFDTSLVTNMTVAFLGSSFDGDLNCWDVSSVLEMRSMFQEAYNFNGAISDWDVSSVSDMSRMFYDTDKFNQDLDDWEVSGVFYMERMFQSIPSTGTADFDQCLSTWAEKTPYYVNTFKMFDNTMCPYQTDNPDQMVGPWCQGVAQGCSVPPATTEAPTVTSTVTPTGTPTGTHTSSSSSKSSKSTKKSSKSSSKSTKKSTKSSKRSSS